MIADSQEELLKYYKTELTYLRQMGGVFADRYPKVAKRLELGRDECADPHVERLIEAFALLTARLQHEIDSEFPDITNALFDILYPQLANPIPSMAIAQFNVDPEQKMTTGFPIEKNTALFADAADGVSCRFRTCYPVTLWPLKLAEAICERTSQWSFLDADTDVLAAVKLRLECLTPGSHLQDLELNRLRFYLNGEAMAVKTLYELLFCDLHNVAIQVPGAAAPIYLGTESIKPVGFGLDSHVLPYPPNAHPGYMLLQEYFAFPKQYFFFDLCFDQSNPDRRGTTNTLLDFLDPKVPTRSIDVLLLLNRRPRENLLVDEKTFCLGCTPIINLFPKTTEPIRLDHRSLEYPLVADKRRERLRSIRSFPSRRLRTRTIQPRDLSPSIPTTIACRRPIIVPSGTPGGWPRSERICVGQTCSCLFWILISSRNCRQCRPFMPIRCAQIGRWRESCRGELFYTWSNSMRRSILNSRSSVSRNQASQLQRR